MFTAVFVGLVYLSALANITLLFQRKLQYIERTEHLPKDWIAARKDCSTINYQSFDNTHQTSYYIPPKKGQAKTLYLYLHGKSGQATDWLPFITLLDEPTAGHLFIEYPGFGTNLGHANAFTTISSTLRAVESIRTFSEPNIPPIHIIGHSLGCSLALECARWLPNTRQVSLISPFYNGITAGKRLIGSVPTRLLGHFLWDSYNNARLLTLLKHEKHYLNVCILHGTADTIVPFADSQALLKHTGNWLKLYTFKDLEHNLALFVNDKTMNLIKRAE